MKLTSFEAIVHALNEAGVRYLLAGGLAVNAYGYLRFTNDAGIVGELMPDNIKRAFVALAAPGYQPVVPVTAEQFADRATRESWTRDKGMQVSQLWSDRHRETSIDMFAREPFPFNDEYAKALIKPLYGSIEVRFVSIPTTSRLSGIFQDSLRTSCSSSLLRRRQRWSQIATTCKSSSFTDFASGFHRTRRHHGCRRLQYS